MNALIRAQVLLPLASMSTRSSFQVNGLVPLLYLAEGAAEDAAKVAVSGVAGSISREQNSIKDAKSVRLAKNDLTNFSRCGQQGAATWPASRLTASPERGLHPKAS